MKRNAIIILFCCFILLLSCTGCSNKAPAEPQTIIEYVDVPFPEFIFSDDYVITIDSSISILSAANLQSKNVVIPTKSTKDNRVEYIAPYAFSYRDLESIDFSNTIVNVGAHAFELCTKMKTINNTNNIKTVDEFAFASSGITEIWLRDVETIGDFAFLCCNNLEEIHIGGSCKSIGLNILGICPKLQTIYFDGDSTLWNELTTGQLTVYGSGEDNGLDVIFIICSDGTFYYDK